MGCGTKYSAMVIDNTFCSSCEQVVEQPFSLHQQQLDNMNLGNSRSPVAIEIRRKYIPVMCKTCGLSRINMTPLEKAKARFGLTDAELRSLLVYRKRRQFRQRTHRKWRIGLMVVDADCRAILRTRAQSRQEPEDAHDQTQLTSRQRDYAATKLRRFWSRFPFRLCYLPSPPFWVPQRNSIEADVMQQLAESSVTLNQLRNWLESSADYDKVRDEVLFVMSCLAKTFGVPFGPLGGLPALHSNPTSHVIASCRRPADRRFFDAKIRWAQVVWHGFKSTSFAQSLPVRATTAIQAFLPHTSWLSKH